MLKKIFCAAMICAAAYCAATYLLINAASAQDVWIANYGRSQCYVMTETFINRTQYRANRAFSVEVKFVGATEEVMTANYSFRENDGLIFCSVDGGKDLFVERGTVEEKIWLFGLEFLGIDYEVSYR